MSIPPWRCERRRCERRRCVLRLGVLVWSALHLLALGAALPACTTATQATTLGADEQRFVLTADSLYAGDGSPRWASLPAEGWCFLAADGSRPEVATWWPAGSADDVPAGWVGDGAFELSFDVADELVGQPLVLRIEQRGAFALWLDGEPVDRAGLFPTPEFDFVPRNQRQPAVVVFERSGEHRLRVDYANPRVSSFHRNGHAAGFRVAAAPAEFGLRRTLENDALHHRYQGLLTGIFLAVALLHLLLFVFWPETPENLWFALLCVSVAILEGCLFHYPLAESSTFLLWVEPAMNTAGLLMCLASLRFVYGIFRPDLFTGHLFTGGWPRRLRWALVPIVALAILAAVWPARFTVGVFFVLLATSLELLRVTVLAIRDRREGSLLIGAGIAAMAVGFGVGVLTLLGVLPPSFLRSTVLPFVSVVVLVLTMSVHLSRSVARTSAALRRKLVEVERLSEEKLEHERRARHEAVERERLKAEVRHKQQELEEARALQLAMLPRRLPEVPDLEVAAHMETATEVGGDYYDFDVAGDGSLTVAIGDATGHGMRAGTMVTATKSLFKALGEGALVDTLDRSSKALKAMNLRKLSMALILARWHAGRLRVASAGMPPVYLYRAAHGAVEDLLLPGLPLGGPLRGRYQEADLRLEPGDTVLFLSDGFPERLDAEDEIFGYERTEAAFAAVADQPARAIVQALVSSSQEWAAGRPLDDDLTFVVLKARAA